MPDEAIMLLRDALDAERAISEKLRAALRAETDYVAYFITRIADVVNELDLAELREAVDEAKAALGDE